MHWELAVKENVGSKHTWTRRGSGRFTSGDRHRVCEASWGCPPSVREVLPTGPYVAQRI
jgi:hypothetical protein